MDMVTRSQRSDAERQGSPAYLGSSPFSDLSIAPDDRLGRPRARSKLAHAVRGGVVVAVLGAGGWGLARDDAQGARWVIASVASAMAAFGDKTPAAPAVSPPPAPVVAAAPPLAPLAPVHEVSVAPVSIGTPAVPAEDTEAKPGAEAAATSSDAPAAEGEEKPQPLPKLPPLTDPLQKRAEAIGLHPDVSRAVLARFSSVDFRNAGAAIAKALKETRDDEHLVWPAQRQKGRAQFRVHFVPGVSDDCRRYIVGVAFEGWLTTALPMEKCGIKPLPAKGKFRAGAAKG